MLPRLTNDSSNWWPPKPLVLGNRVYHWYCWHVMVTDTVYTSNFLQLSITDLENNTSRSFRSKALRLAKFAPNDELDFFGIGDQVETPNLYTNFSLINKTQKHWCLDDAFWNEPHWHTADQYFGVPSRRSAVRDLIDRSFAAACEVCLRTLGHTGPELQRLVEDQTASYVRGWIKFNFSWLSR